LLRFVSLVHWNGELKVRARCGEIAAHPLTCRLADLQFQARSIEQMAFNDLEFAYAPVRTQVRDLREYL
jgi:hypothetical protein